MAQRLTDIFNVSDAPAAKVVQRRNALLSGCHGFGVVRNGRILEIKIAGDHDAAPLCGRYGVLAGNECGGIGAVRLLNRLRDEVDPESIAARGEARMEVRVGPLARVVASQAARLPEC